MSYVNSPQPGRYTTKLLTNRLPAHPRDRLALAIVMVGVLLFAGGIWVGTRPAAEPQLQPRVNFVYIIATPLPAPTILPAPTATPMPTAEPVIIFQTVEVPVYIEAEQAQQVTQQDNAPAFEQPPEPTATPPAMLYGEKLSEYFERTGITPETVP